MSLNINGILVIDNIDGIEKEYEEAKELDQIIFKINKEYKVHVNDIGATIVKKMHGFAKRTNTDQDLKMELPDKGDIKIAKTYIANNGTLNEDNDIMIDLFIKYPEYVSVGNIELFSEKVLDKYIEHTEGIDNDHYDLLVSSIKHYDKCDHIMMTQYGKLYVLCSAKYYKIIPYLQTIYDSVRDEMVPMPPYDVHNDTELELRKPFTVYAKSADDLSKIFDNGITENICIDGDIGAPIFKLAKGKVILNPEDFATWTIGKNCTSFKNLFEDAPFEPHIYNWDTSGIKSIYKAFHFAKVRDLSMMSFPSVIECTNVFRFSTIEYPPKFPNATEFVNTFVSCEKLQVISKETINPDVVEEIHSLCTKCYQLHTLDFDGCTFKKLTILCIGDDCYALKSAFNNCIFDACERLRCTFSQFYSLEHAFNGCVFKRLFVILDTFRKCTALKSAFNNCQFCYDLICDNTFDTCINLQSIFNECNLIVLVKKTLCYNCINFDLSDSFKYTTVRVNDTDKFINCPLVNNKKFMDEHLV